MVWQPCKALFVGGVLAVQLTGYSHPIDIAAQFDRDFYMKSIYNGAERMRTM
jgi:hypothetical protein